VEGMQAVALLADRYAALGASTRTAIEIASREGDADTSDLFTGISRGLDKALWFLEAHLQ
jgi:starvation-inducible DNA-binding protein